MSAPLPIDEDLIQELVALRLMLHSCYKAKSAAAAFYRRLYRRFFMLIKLMPDNEEKVLNLVRLRKLLETVRNGGNPTYLIDQLEESLYE